MAFNRRLGSLLDFFRTKEKGMKKRNLSIILKNLASTFTAPVTSEIATMSSSRRSPTCLLHLEGDTKTIRLNRMTRNYVTKKNYLKDPANLTSVTRKSAIHRMSTSQKDKKCDEPAKKSIIDDYCTSKKNGTQDTL